MFFDLVADKTVALVGNSVSSMEQKNGEAIDSYGVVIRCNRSFLRCNPVTIGTKTDILILGSPGQSRDYMGFDLSRVKAFVWTKSVESGKRLSKSCPGILRHPCLIYYDMKRKDELTAELGGLPTSGMMAFDMLTHPVIGFRHLHIYGFDFFQTGTAYSGLNRATKWHNPTNEKAKIMRLVDVDPRITFHPC